MNTLALWAGPAFFLSIAAIGFVLYVRRRSVEPATPATASLTAAEQGRIDELLGERSST